MKKNVIVMVFLLVSIILSTSTLNAAETNKIQHGDKADSLKELGLFQGTKNGYELDRKATRAEGAVMLVRLLGKESEALEKIIVIRLQMYLLGPLHQLGMYIRTVLQMA